MDKQNFLEMDHLPIRRVEGFSDAFIAIIITLMILEIPLPEKIEMPDLLIFGKSIIIYFASFIIVGVQWTKHHILLNEMQSVSQKFIWKNMLCLFLMSLIPIFMKWLLEYPTSIIPAIAYSVTYIVNELGMRWLFKENMEDHKKELFKEGIKQRKMPEMGMLAVLFVIFILLLVLSWFYPEVAIICFIIFPVIMSMVNIFNK